MNMKYTLKRKKALRKQVKNKTAESIRALKTGEAEERMVQSKR